MALDLPTGWDRMIADERFAAMVVEANDAWLKTMVTRCPEFLQPHLREYLDAYNPTPSDPNEATVTNGEVVEIRANYGNPVPRNATVSVVDGEITSIVLESSIQTVRNGDPMVVERSTGAMVAAQTIRIDDVGGVHCRLYPQFALVTNGASVVVNDPDGAIQGSPGRASITLSLLNSVDIAGPA